MTRIVNKKFLVLGAMFLSGCSYFNSVYTRHIVQPLVKNPTSVVVCREKQCAPARLSMSREYIYNSLTQLLQNNKGTKALLCTADAASHTCTEEFLSMPIKVGITPANMYIDSVKITNVKAGKGTPKVDLYLNYNVTYNGQTPFCKPAKTTAFVESPDSIMMEDSGYSCQMTVIGNSSIRTMFAIDYIDLDYGYIGGYYSIGVSGPANGGGAGYMLIRLPINAYPLSPALTSFEDEKKAEEYYLTRPSFTHGPAMLQEKMIHQAPDMTFSGPNSINGRPVTRIVVDNAGNITTKNNSSLQVFPIYGKKDEVKTGTVAKKGSDLKKTLKETNKKAERK